MFCLVNGSIQPLSGANVSIQDLGLIRGYGIFDFFRLANGVPLFMDDHLDRFHKGAKAVKLDVGITQKELKSLILELVNRNDMPMSGIRIVLTGGVGGGPYGIGRPNIFITQEPISFPHEKHYQQGVKLITHEYLRDIPSVKTTGYMTGIWLQDEVKAKKAFDVLYVHNGFIHELTRSNVFGVTTENTIVTPSRDVLLGITRKHLLAAMEGQYSIYERNFSTSELGSIKELFLTGTTKRVLPIVQVDDTKIGDGKPGPVTKNLMELFRNIEEEYIQNFQ